MDALEVELRAEQAEVEAAGRREGERPAPVKPGRRWVATHRGVVTLAAVVVAVGLVAAGTYVAVTRPPAWTPPAPAAVRLPAAATAIAAGDAHTCAELADGSVFCWGWNGAGQLGDGTIHTDWFVPVKVVGLGSAMQAVAARGGHTCALLATGSVSCWGDNEFGQLGDGTTTNRSAPVKVAGLGSPVQAVAAGSDHTCVLLADGSVSCWGWNAYRQLGDGTTMNRSAPVKVVALHSAVQAVAAGSDHTCVLLADGSVSCWGRNGDGQLGDGTTTDWSGPQEVVGLYAGVQAVAAGLHHTCALRVNGTVHCWGRNRDGQLGDGTTTDRSEPAKVVDLDSAVQAVAAGNDHTCALLGDGSVNCWGWNGSGQLGDGTTTNRSAPVKVAGLGSPVQAIAASGDRTCALLADGSVCCWGYGT